MTVLNLNVWPVVQRELREGARRPVNHRLRFLSAGVGTVLLWIVLSNLNLPPEEAGVWLFGWLHTLLLGLILIIVPALTADCIAREKREGTLGLLFLTSLSAGGIVAGKALTQALRALTLWLAVLPILTIPFMTGGVTLFDALSAFSLEFCATILCLGAGLLATSLAKQRNAAFVLALLFGVLFLFVFMEIGQLVLFAGPTGLAVSTQQAWWDMSDETMTIFSGLLEIRGSVGWAALSTISPVFAGVWELFCCISPVVTLLLFCVLGWFAARRIEKSWQDKIPSRRQESLVRKYCTPVFREYFRRAMNRTLDRNPIAWLQQYSWKARLSKWGLCLAFIIVLCVMVDAGPSTLGATEFVLLVSFAGIYTFFGVSGFLEEKRSGALELLLVTPVSVNRLIFGRVWGLWKQFLPSGVILFASYAFTQSFLSNSREMWHHTMQTVSIIACGFLALPIFATYFALRVKNLIVAATLTWVALCIPIFLIPDLYNFTYEADLDSLLAAAFAGYVGLSMVACYLLRHSLSRRIYSF